MVYFLFTNVMPPPRIEEDSGKLRRSANTMHLLCGRMEELSEEMG